MRGFFLGVILSGVGSLVEEVNTFEDANGGISVSNGVVTKCTASRNGALGVFAPGFGIGGLNSLLHQNASNVNKGVGFSLQQSTATDNVATGNGGAGFNGSTSLVGNDTSVGNGAELGTGLTSAGANSCSGSRC